MWRIRSACRLKEPRVSQSSIRQTYPLLCRRMGLVGWEGRREGERGRLGTRDGGGYKGEAYPSLSSGRAVALFSCSPSMLRDSGSFILVSRES